MSYIGVFIEGLASFMSPCILPLIPLYMAYIAGTDTGDGNNVKRRIRIFITTFFFTLGISTVYFILAIASDVIRDVITDISDIVMIIGGIIMIVIALYQLGIIDIKAFNKEYSFRDKFDTSGMNFLKAFLLGFVFSFAWTPCIGPMMANVLILASTSEAIVGNLLILFYALGFTIPFLLLGIFYDLALSFIKKHQGIIIKISKVAAVIIILFGVYMVYDASVNIYDTKVAYEKLLASSRNTQEDTSSQDTVSMYEFELYDQYGNVHTLSDYEGKYVALNFVASWCTYCISEIDDYKAFADSLDEDEVVALYVMSDNVNSQRSDMTTDEFIEEYGIEVPVLHDDDTMFNYLGISSFPTIAYIGPDGTYIGYQSGALDSDTMMEIFNLAKERYESR